MTAEQLPQVHKAVERLAALVDIQHWYDPEPLGVAPQADAPAMGDVPGTNAKLVYQRPSLVDEILRLASHPGGVTRAFLKEAAAGYSPPFNPGSISPTLVKLMKDKRIKRTGSGVYEAKK